MELTKEQQEKIYKLEKEIEQKRINEEQNKQRKLETSKRTGIPYNLVDNDVVKIGTLLGLIKSVNGEKTETLLDILLGGFDNKDEVVVDIPAYFSLSPNRVSEEYKQKYQYDFVEKQCDKFNSFIYGILNTSLKLVDSVICLGKTPTTLETFVSQVTEAMNSVLDCLEDEDDDEIWDQLKILRNCLLGPIGICEYKKLLVNQIYKLGHKKESLIYNNLSYVDSQLILFGDFKSKKIDDSIKNIEYELSIRTFMKDPALRAFDMNTISKECCVPSYMFLQSPHDIIKNGIVGPFRNNCIGFVQLNPTLKSTFYILKQIQGNVRMWVLDEHLTTFSEKLRNTCLDYCIKLFRIVYKEYFGNNDFKRENFYPTLKNLLNSINFMLKPKSFRKFICSIIHANSPIIATELDTFNEIPEKENIINLAEQIRYPSKLFDSPVDDDFVKENLYN
jgi:hypothetical protein